MDDGRSKLTDESSMGATDVKGARDFSSELGSLVGWWRFDDPVGTRHWLDDSAFQNPLESWRFSEQHKFAEAVPGTGLNGSPGIRFYSRSAAKARGVPWFRTACFWERRDPGSRRVDKWLQAFADDKVVISLDLDGSNNLRAHFCNTSGFCNTSASGAHARAKYDPSDGSWRHIAVVLSASSIHLYANGKELHSSEHTMAGLGGTSVSLKIGTGAPHNQFLGVMDELRLYSLPLSPQVVAALAAAGSTSGIMVGENLPPRADAGPTLMLWKPTQSAALNGKCADDGKPKPMAAVWEVLSGPDVSAVKLADTAVAATRVSLIDRAPAGDYVLQLNCSDGALWRTSHAKLVVFQDETVEAHIPMLKGKSANGSDSISRSGGNSNSGSSNGSPVGFGLGAGSGSVNKLLYFYVDDGCSAEEGPADDVPSYYAQATLKAASPRCCSPDASSCTSPIGCPAPMTQAEAQEACVSHGGRLCSRRELLSEVCCGTGGACDDYPVWTDTERPVAQHESVNETPGGCAITEGSAPNKDPCRCGDRVCDANQLCDVTLYDGACFEAPLPASQRSRGHPIWGYPEEGNPVFPMSLWYFDGDAESHSLGGVEATLIAVAGQGDLGEFVEEGRFGGAMRLSCNSSIFCGQLELGNPEFPVPWNAISVTLWFKSNSTNRLSFVEKGSFKMKPMKSPDAGKSWENSSWHHYVVSQDHSVTKAWLDGQMLYMKSGATNRTQKDAMARLWLGIRDGRAGKWQSGFAGDLDELAVFDFVLSNEEVEMLYSEGVSVFKRRGRMNPYWRGSYNKTMLQTYFRELPEDPDYSGFVFGTEPSKESPPAYHHPRILFTQEHLPDLRDRLRNTKAGHVGMENLRSLLEMSWPYEEMADGDVEPGGVDGQLVVMQAFRTLIDGDREMAEILQGYLSRYADVVQLKLEERLRARREEPWDLGRSCGDDTCTWQHIGQVVLDRGVMEAFCYDWLYPYLQEGTREKLRRLIATGTQNTWAIGMDAIEAYQSLTSNWVAWVTGDLILTILSIEGEEGFDAGVYSRAALAYRGWVTLGISALSGATYEGGGKNAATAPKLLALALHGFPQYMAMPGLRKHAIFILHTIMPNGNVAKDDEWGSTEDPPLLEDFAALKFAFPDDKVVNWVYRDAVTGHNEHSRFRDDTMPYHAYSPDTLRLYSYNNFLSGLVYATDWDGPENWTDHTKLALSEVPLTFVAEDLGVLITRSKWGDRDAAWLWFNVRSLPGGHAARARGEFCFYALGEVWASYVTGSNEASLLHSVVLVDGQGMGAKVPGKFVQFQDSQEATFGTVDARAAYSVEQVGGSWGSLVVNNYTLRPLPYRWGELAWADLPNWQSGTTTDLEGGRKIDRTPPGTFLKAFRTVGLVRSALSPYALVLDDVQRDDVSHEYAWRMQLRKSVPVFDPASGLTGFVEEDRSYFQPDGNDFVLKQSGGGDARLLVRLLPGSTPYKSAGINSSTETRSECLQVTVEVVHARFRVLLYPFRVMYNAVAPPMPTTTWTPGEDGRGILRIGSDEITLVESPEGATIVQGMEISPGRAVELTTNEVHGYTGYENAPVSQEL